MRNTGFRQIIQQTLLLCLLLCSPWIAIAQERAEQFTYRIVNTFPHDMSSFTQGLVYHQGFLFEGSGKRGLSTLRKINLEDAEVQMSKQLNRRYFGEGIEIVGDKIYQLTWESHMVFVYDKASFEQLGSHYNATQGWGLAFDGSALILSDGSTMLQFMDPETFAPIRKVEVTLNGTPIQYLNELEYIDGEVWANVWQTDYILRIDPATGKVNSSINLKGLSDNAELGSSEAVLNGIAWDADNRRLFVTGKHWSKLFEIELVATP